MKIILGVLMLAMTQEIPEQLQSETEQYRLNYDIRIDAPHGTGIVRSNTVIHESSELVIDMGKFSTVLTVFTISSEQYKVRISFPLELGGDESLRAQAEFEFVGEYGVPKEYNWEAVDAKANIALIVGHPL